MALRDVTADGVRAAIAEFDQLGRHAFLAKYGFKPARNCYLVVEGKQYDSKAIVGAAHGYSAPGLEPLGPADFSGGEFTVGRRLARLGFEQERPWHATRNPPWADPELVLALHLYLSEGLLDDRHPSVVALSEELNRLPIHSERPDAWRFRNPNGVALKLANFAALDPGYGGRGMTRGGRRDREIWDLYAGNEDALRAAVARIREGQAPPTASPPTPAPTTTPTATPIPVEDLKTPHFTQERTVQSAEAERREQRLVHDFKAYLEAQGHEVCRHRYDVDGLVMYSDLFDETGGVLYEAKGDVSRSSVRMAVGQLLDYARFHETRPALAVLLPREPSNDLKTFLQSVDVGLSYRRVASGELPDSWCSPSVVRELQPMRLETTLTS